MNPAVAKSDLFEFWSNKNGSLSASEITLGSNKIVLWVCPKGHGFSTSPKILSRRKKKCPDCHSHEPFIHKFPELLKEWDYEETLSDPSKFTFGSRFKAHWICPIGHKWAASIAKRTSGGQGCPYCANKLTLKGFNDLATLRPHLIKLWSNKNLEKPDAIYAFSSKKFWFNCPNGHHFYRKLIQINDKTPCYLCNPNASIVEGINDLKTLHPKLVKEWDFNKNKIKPSEIGVGSRRKVWWLCSNNHSWKYEIKSRIQLGVNCKVCSGRELRSGVNDLYFLYPNLAELWSIENKFSSNEITISGEEQYFWSCPLNHKWKSTIRAQINATYGCPYCDGFRVQSGFNDFATKYPTLGDEWDYKRNTTDPTLLSYGSRLEEYWWKCKNGHSWKSTLNQRTQYKRLRLCPECHPSNTWISQGEIELAEFVKTFYKKEIVKNDRSLIHPYEIDVLLPDEKVALEFNGDYWHSNEVISQTKNFDTAAGYHSYKKELCENKGYILAFVWEHDWLFKNDEIKKSITSFVKMKKLGKILKQLESPRWSEK